MREHRIYFKSMSALLYMSIVSISVGTILYFIDKGIGLSTISMAIYLLTLSPFVGLSLLGAYYLKNKDYKTFINVVIVFLIALLNLINLLVGK